MHARPVLRLQALLLVAVTVGLATGVPSHHHERPDAGPIVVDSGHHGHATQLLDQGDRQTAELVAVGLPAAPMVKVPEATPVLTGASASAPRPVARGQPPPSNRPRAPPVSA